MARKINQVIRQGVVRARRKKQKQVAADSNSLPNMFTASSGNTTCNNVAEKAPQRDNETLVDEEMLPVAADDSAEEKRRYDAQSKLQAYVESIPNGTFVSRLPLVNDDDEGGLSLDIDSDDDSEYGKDNDRDEDDLEDDEANACESSTEKSSAKVSRKKKRHS